ncbi:MAG: AsmA family protein [Burkholderiaceae bacterium]
MLKKTVTWILILVALLVVAAIALVIFVDVNRFKPQIESFVKDTYGRTLTIDGDLSLKVFPRVALALPASRLSDPKSETSALSLDSARVSVAVMPLISGRVEAEKVQLHGLKANLVRFADGSTSIDDLMGAPAAPTETQSTTEKPSAGLSDFRIGGVEILDAVVTVRDEVTKNTISMTNLNLETGVLQDNQKTPVKLTVSVTATNPKAQAEIALDGQVQFEISAARYTVHQADLSVVGNLDGMAINQKLAVTSLRGGAKSMTADMIALTGQVKQPGRQLQTRVQFPLEFDPERGLVKLRAISGQIDLTDPLVSPNPVAIPLSGDANINLNAETVAARLKISAPEAIVDVVADVKGFGKPAIRLDLSSDSINLDRYLPPAAETKAQGDDSKTNAPNANATAKADDAVIDLSALNDLKFDGQVSIGRLLAQGLTVTRIETTIKSAGGEVNVAPLSLDLYGGSMTGKAALQTKNNRFTLSSDLTGVNIGPLVKDMTKDDLIEGAGEVRLRLQSSGATVGAIKKALAGDARVALRDGAIMGINLGQKIRDAKNLLQAGGAQSEASVAGARTDFAALTASFKIANGVATNTDLSGKSPLLRLGGGGTIDIAAGSLDYTVRASVVGTSKGQEGKEIDELRGVTIPVRLTGAFEALQWQIDWGEAAKSALKSRVAEQLSGQVDVKKAELKAQADEKKEQAKAKAQAKVEELKEKAASKIGDKLKGLLGQ